MTMSDDDDDDDDYDEFEASIRKQSAESNAMAYQGGEEPRLDPVAIGWKGPGARETSSRKRKNEQLVEAALRRYTGTSFLIDLLGYGLVKPEDIFPPKVLNKKFAPHNREYYGRIDAMDDLYHEGLMAGNSGNVDVQKQDFLKLEMDLEVFFRDLKHMLVKVGIYGHDFVPGFLGACLSWRAHARFALGTLEDDKVVAEAWFSGAVDDGTCGLWFFNLEYQREEPKSKVASVMLFLARGRASKALGDLDQALTDFRAACASIRLVGEEWKRDPTINDATDEVVRTLALMKVNAPRPHYTPEEREKWQRELGLDLYEKGIYKCGYCGRHRSDEVKLSRCSKCKQRWFCSPDCLAKAWKIGHKKECKELRELGGFSFSAINRTVFNELAEVIEKDGYAILGSTVNAFQIIMRDPSTGNFFESFSNCEMGKEWMPGLSMR